MKANFDDRAVRRVAMRGMIAATLALGMSAARASAARAQAPTLDSASAIEVRRYFIGDLDALHKKFVALAQAFPADKYAWRPRPGVRSVGEVFMHVASEFYFYSPLAYGATPSYAAGRGEADFPKFEQGGTKAAVLSHLDASYAYARDALDKLPASALVRPHPWFGAHIGIVPTSFGMTDDLHEHLGQLIAYARMNGVVPPWSK